MPYDALRSNPPNVGGMKATPDDKMSKNVAFAFPPAEDDKSSMCHSPTWDAYERQKKEKEQANAVEARKTKRLVKPPPPGAVPRNSPYSIPYSATSEANVTRGRQRERAASTMVLPTEMDLPPPRHKVRSRSGSFVSLLRAPFERRRSAERRNSGFIGGIKLEFERHSEQQTAQQHHVNGQPKLTDVHPALRNEMAQRPPRERKYPPITRAVNKFSPPVSPTAPDPSKIDKWRAKIGFKPAKSLPPARPVGHAAKPSLTGSEDSNNVSEISSASYCTAPSPPTPPPPRRSSKRSSVMSFNEALASSGAPLPPSPRRQFAASYSTGNLGSHTFDQYTHMPFSSSEDSGSDDFHSTADVSTPATSRPGSERAMSFKESMQMHRPEEKTYPAESITDEGSDPIQAAAEKVLAVFNDIPVKQRGVRRMTSQSTLDTDLSLSSPKPLNVRPKQRASTYLEQARLYGPRPQMPTEVAKVFVECCACKHYHDMPNNLHPALAHGGAVSMTVRCTWCKHEMGTTCCARLTTTVHIVERQ